MGGPAAVKNIPIGDQDYDPDHRISITGLFAPQSEVCILTSAFLVYNNAGRANHERYFLC